MFLLGFPPWTSARIRHTGLVVMQVDLNILHASAIRDCHLVNSSRAMISLWSSIPFTAADWLLTCLFSRLSSAASTRTLSAFFSRLQVIIARDNNLLSYNYWLTLTKQRNLKARKYNSEEVYRRLYSMESFEVSDSCKLNELHIFVMYYQIALPRVTIYLAF